MLDEHSGATMGRLADLTSVDRTTLTRTLGLMESAGLVIRRARESDRRSLTIALTAKGRRMFARILPLTLAETDRALTGFSSEENRNPPRSTKEDGRQPQGSVTRIRKLGQPSGLRPRLRQRPIHPRRRNISASLDARSGRFSSGSRSTRPDRRPLWSEAAQSSRPLSAGSRAARSSRVRPWRLLAEVRSRNVVPSRCGRGGAWMGLRHPLIHACARSPDRRR